MYKEKEKTKQKKKKRLIFNSVSAEYLCIPGPEKDQIISFSRPYPFGV